MLCNQQLIKQDTLPLNPAQHWLLNYFPRPYEWYDRILFPLELPISVPAVQKAIEYLVDRHDGLRTTFIEDNGHWKQQVQNSISKEEISPLLYHAEEQTQEEYEKTRDELALAYCRQFNLQEGPLFKVLLFKRSEKRCDVLFLFHHIIVDYLACITIFKEFNYLYSAFQNEEKIELSPATSNTQYMHSLSNAMNSSALSEMNNFWQEGKLLPDSDLILNDHPGKECVSKTIRVTIPATQAEKLLRFGKKHFQARSLHHVLVAPLYHALREEVTNDTITISQKLHGRNINSDDFSFISTVGNFAINVPVTCNIDPEDNWNAIIGRVEKRFSEIPLNGLSYDIVHLINQSIPYPDHNIAPIRFNYMGISPYQRLVQRIEHPNQCLTTYIEFFVYFHEKSLHIEIQYDQTSIGQHLVNRLRDNYVKNLHDLISNL
ncbi:MAG: Linear gramicidin synthase subunit B [Chlamydiae bacterium]|nr:Linear gramicidin synthase subunit B [Chlamydiota bacterium]